MALFKAFVPKEVNPSKIRNFRRPIQRVPPPPVEELDPELVGGAITGIGTPTIAGSFETRRFLGQPVKKRWLFLALKPYVYCMGFSL